MNDTQENMQRETTHSLMDHISNQRFFKVVHGNMLIVFHCNKRIDLPLLVIEAKISLICRRLGQILAPMWREKNNNDIYYDDSDNDQPAQLLSFLII